MKDEITALLRARHTLLWITTKEEARVESCLIEAAAAAKYPAFFWDCASGLQNHLGYRVDRCRRREPARALALRRPGHPWGRERFRRGGADHVPPPQGDAMTQLVQVTPRRPAFCRYTFDETLVGYDGTALRFAHGPIIGRCSLDVAWRFLSEVSLYADHELPALFAACVQGERRGLTPGQVRSLAALLLGD